MVKGGVLDYFKGSMTLITTTKDLKSLCTRLKKSAFVTVDTEFIREKTYWPKLCLIQVCGDDEAPFAIDPLAEDLDLKPFYELMQDKKVLKVFHACRQDLEIFFTETGKLPTPVFDTQVAAMVCGFGEQVSYEVLVNTLARKKIDKSSRFTDWALRPLTAKQLKYALADVTHLRKIYIKMIEQLDKMGRTAWIRDEMKGLMNKGLYLTKPEEAWERVRIPNHKPRTLCILREIAAWREQLAQDMNVPRGRILKDEALAEIATHPPTTPEALHKMRNVHQGFGNSERGKTLLEAVKRGLEADEKKCPKWEPRPTFPPGIAPTIELLRVLLKLKCENEQVAPKLLCTAADLEMIAAFGKESKVPAMSGWRFKIFGKEALALREGKVAIAVENSKLKIVQTA
jgi:ribonuclease D